MKSLILIAAAAAAMTVLSANAADSNAPAASRHVSSNALNDLGLGGMSQVTDEQGLQVRGKGRRGGGLTISNNQINLILANPSGTSAPVINVQQNSVKGGNIAIINLGPINIGNTFK